ncbi:MAG: AAA family ATPase [Polyangiaceae bacterium]|nr:AAA family ATPase [Polyangiaceae bacterium]MCB9607842.1 AAA family ATPase [Polyangiaceae bacterium]
MRLTRLIIENFRGFEQLELDLDQPVIVLVGINGSGKTTVLDAIVHCFVGTQPSPSERRAGTSKFDCEGLSGGRPFEVANRQLFGDLGKIPKSSDSVYVHYSVNRRATDETNAIPLPKNPFQDDGFLDPVSFGEFFRWFKSLEDFENQERLKDANYSDPQLAAVRTSVEAVLPGYHNPRVQRSRAPHIEPAVFSVDKGEEQLGFGQFSEGERMLIALAADIARRAALTGHDPPLEAPGVVLIDEIDLHLHPGWQREVLPRLTKTFPNIQFITTTHSPIVVASVPSESIRALQDFKLVDAVKTQDRDPNAILEELFGVSPRPDAIQKELREVAALIDQDKLDDAKLRLQALTEKLGEEDEDVHHLTSLIQLLAG